MHRRCLLLTLVVTVLSLPVGVVTVLGQSSEAFVRPGESPTLMLQDPPRTGEWLMWRRTLR